MFCYSHMMLKEQELIRVRYPYSFEGHAHGDQTFDLDFSFSCTKIPNGVEVRTKTDRQHLPIIHQYFYSSRTQTKTSNM